MKAETLARLQAERAAQRPVVLLTRLTDGEQHLWPAAELSVRAQLDYLEGTTPELPA